MTIDVSFQVWVLWTTLCGGELSGDFLRQSPVRPHLLRRWSSEGPRELHENPAQSRRNLGHAYRRSGKTQDDTYSRPKPSSETSVTLTNIWMSLDHQIPTQISVSQMLQDFLITNLPRFIIFAGCLLIHWCFSDIFVNINDKSQLSSILHQCCYC